MASQFLWKKKAPWSALSMATHLFFMQVPRPLNKFKKTTIYNITTISWQFLLVDVFATLPYPAKKNGWTDGSLFWTLQLSWDAEVPIFATGPSAASRSALEMEPFSLICLKTWQLWKLLDGNQKSGDLPWKIQEVLLHLRWWSPDFLHHSSLLRNKKESKREIFEKKCVNLKHKKGYLNQNPCDFAAKWRNTMLLSSSTLPFSSPKIPELQGCHSCSSPHPHWWASILSHSTLCSEK